MFVEMNKSILKFENPQERGNAIFTTFSLILMLNFFEHINHTKIKQLQSWIILDVTGQKNVLRRILECESEYDPSNFCILACLSLETLIKKILLKKNSVSNLNEKKESLNVTNLVIWFEIQKQPSRDILVKRYSENMQQIYRRAPISKCDFNKVALKIYWNRTSAWMFSWNIAA